MNLEISMSSLEIVDRRKRRYSNYVELPRDFRDINENTTDDLQLIEDCQEEEEEPQQLDNINEHIENNENIEIRRSARKRLHTSFYEASNKRRVQMKPRKLDEQNFETIKNYYLDKTIKRLPSTLETIFENPQEFPDGLRYWSLRKYRRSLNFNELHEYKRNPTKIKKRSMKVKAMNSRTKQANRKKLAISIEYVENYLKEMLDQD